MTSITPVGSILSQQATETPAADSISQQQTVLAVSQKKELYTHGDFL